MNTIALLGTLPFLIAVIDTVRNPCKDVTFGGCNLQGSDMVLSKKHVQTVQLCNEECYNTDNCTNYRYISETKECTLTKKEYRHRCNIRAGPMDYSENDCMELIRNQECGSHLEEECEYDGELLDEDNSGNILDSDSCQTFCGTFCKYWIYHRREHSCISKTDGRRRCTAWGGPKEPSYDQCKNLTM